MASDFIPDAARRDGEDLMTLDKAGAAKDIGFAGVFAPINNVSEKCGGSAFALVASRFQKAKFVFS